MSFYARLGKTLKLAVLGTVSGGSLYFFHKNDYSLDNIGIIRFARVGVAATATFVDYKLSLRTVVSEDEYESKLKECHIRGARRLLEMAKQNGGVFIKVGQHISSLQYLLPDEYTKTFSVLHSNAPESNYDEICAVFKQNIGRELEELFVKFNVKPCGAASLAQVHEATLRDSGERVAVKIQHPKVKARSVVDIATMEFFTRAAAAIFPEFRLMWLVEETKKNLPKELDFLHEAKNADRVREMFAHLTFLKVPKIYYNLSTDQVLTMEFCDGGQIDDLEYFEKHKLDKHDICRKLGKLYSEMIFVRGYIHCDPHPGNVLVRRNHKTGEEEIVLLDHGLYQNLDEKLRVDYSNLWLALMRADKDEIQRICTRMGLREYFGLFACIVTLRSWQSITQGMTKVEVSDEERAEVKQFASTLIPQISTVLDIMPRQMLLILKTNDLIRSIAHNLNSEDLPDSFIEKSFSKIQTTLSSSKSIADDALLHAFRIRGLNAARLYLVAPSLAVRTNVRDLDPYLLLRKMFHFNGIYSIYYVYHFDALSILT